MKHIYYAGLRSYMMSAYNIIIYCILALYMCSYTLRIIVYGWVRDSDVFFNATNRIEELIQRNESRLVKPMVEGWKSSTQSSASYFIEACKLVLLTLFRTKGVRIYKQTREGLGHMH